MFEITSLSRGRLASFRNNRLLLRQRSRIPGGDPQSLGKRGYSNIRLLQRGDEYDLVPDYYLADKIISV